LADILYLMRPHKKIISGNQKKTTPNRHLEQEPVRLNKLIANAGVCSRREADKLISKGKITVNGKVVSELGFKVLLTDKVKFGNQHLKPQKSVYVLLNKPKGFITTSRDPQNRKTVMNLVSKATSERLFSVGRLDRNTMGLLLFTNDGDLAKKLSHPSYKIKKIYQVDLDKALIKPDLEKITAGFELEDGFFNLDKISIISNDKKTIGIELHIGKNRIVRRIFEHLGYKVKKLDRSVYAGLTKKDLPRGKWRHLSKQEIITLKYLK